jgi:hypothetical protein
MDSTIYCISTSPEDDNNPNTPQNDRLSVVYTTDNGQTWQDYAVTSTGSEHFVASTTAQASNNNAWFYIDLGSPQPIARLKWRGGVGGPYPAHLPADYSIQV